MQMQEHVSEDSLVARSLGIGEIVTEDRFPDPRVFDVLLEVHARCGINDALCRVVWQKKLTLVAKIGTIFQLGFVNMDLTIAGKPNRTAPERLGGRTCNHVTFLVEVGSMAGAFEPPLRLKPVWRAAQVRAPRPKAVESVSFTHNPYAPRLL
jgi:hypothetical protein